MQSQCVILNDTLHRFRPVAVKLTTTNNNNQKELFRKLIPDNREFRMIKFWIFGY